MGAKAGRVGTRRINVRVRNRPYWWRCRNLDVFLDRKDDRIVHGDSGCVVTTLDGGILGMIQSGEQNAAKGAVMLMGHVHHGMQKIAAAHVELSLLTRLIMCSCNNYDRLPFRFEESGTERVDGTQPGG